MLRGESGTVTCLGVAQVLQQTEFDLAGGGLIGRPLNRGFLLGDALGGGAAGDLWRCLVGCGQGVEISGPGRRWVAGGVDGGDPVVVGDVRVQLVELSHMFGPRLLACGDLGVAEILQQAEFELIGGDLVGRPLNRGPLVGDAENGGTGDDHRDFRVGHGGEVPHRAGVGQAGGVGSDDLPVVDGIFHEIGQQERIEGQAAELERRRIGKSQMHIVGELIAGIGIGAFPVQNQRSGHARSAVGGPQEGDGRGIRDRLPGQQDFL